MFKSLKSFFRLDISLIYFEFMVYENKLNVDTLGITNLFNILDLIQP